MAKHPKWSYYSLLTVVVLGPVFWCSAQKRSVPDSTGQDRLTPNPCAVSNGYTSPADSVGANPVSGTWTCSDTGATVAISAIPHASLSKPLPTPAGPSPIQNPSGSSGPASSSSQSLLPTVQYTVTRSAQTGMVAYPPSSVANSASGQSCSSQSAYYCAGGSTNKLASCALDPQSCAGGDVGAWISAADQEMGTACGTIEVPPGIPGLLAVTSPVISPCHVLWVRSPITWTVSPKLASDSAIQGDGPGALQTLPVGSWITSGGCGVAGANDLRIENLWMEFTSSNADNTVLTVFGSSAVIFSRNHIVNGGALHTGTAAPGCRYEKVDASNQSSNILADDNYVDGGMPAFGIDAFVYAYTRNVVDSNNYVQNVAWAHTWWGGDSNPAVNGASANPRWASNMTFEGGTAVNTVAAWWGSMGDDITVSNVTVDTCGDVGLDAEGSFRIFFNSFHVKNCRNGGLATFHEVHDIEFGPGFVESDSSENWLASWYNVSLNPWLAAAISVHSVEFVCTDGFSLCHLHADPIGFFDFSNNVVLNAVFDAYNMTDFSAKKNAFNFSYTPADSFTALQLRALDNASELGGNRFTSETAQSTNSQTIQAVQAFNPNAQLSTTKFVQLPSPTIPTRSMMRSGQLAGPEGTE